MKKITIEEFKKFKEKVKEFITDDAETFYYRFLMESIHNPNFMVKVNKIIDYVSRDRSAHEIEELFNILRAEGEQKFINADEATDEITKVNENLSGLAYFCLVEALNENSSFSEKIIKDIKGKYGNKYLETLSRIDRSYLSVDGKKVLKEENKSSLPNDEEMKKYIIMKKWQDKQRTYSFRRIRPLYLKEEKYIGEKEPNLMRLHEKTLIKRAMQDLEKNELIEIDEIAKYCEAGLDKEMIKKFGGKAYGLAKLTAKGIHIPKTYCLAVDSKIQDINLTELDLTKKYAVRSSADIEDGGKNSFAGMFDSFLNTPLQMDMTFPNNNRVKNDLLNVHYIKKEFHDIGLIELKLDDGFVIRIYNAERTICDIIRDRNKIDLQIFNTAINEYMKRRDKNLILLSEYAEKFKIGKILAKYMEVLG